MRASTREKYTRHEVEGCDDGRGCGEEGGKKGGEHVEKKERGLNTRTRAIQR